MIYKIVLLTFLIVASTACQKTETSGPALTTVDKEKKGISQSDSAAPFLTQPLSAQIVETTNGALALWRQNAPKRPALVMVANNPAMLPPALQARTGIDRLLKGGSDRDLVWNSSPINSDPLFLPVMSLNVALDAGWFSEVVWIFPTNQPLEKLNLATFQEQLVAAGIASPEEAATFTLNSGRFSGKVHGLPFTAAPAEGLPPLHRQALLHIDIDYFKNLYKGEIKTPLYPLMADLLKKIQAQQWEVAAITVALSNLQFDGLPLQTRFLGKDLAAIIKDPRLLEGGLPPQWERRSKALYLENFMQSDEIVRLYLEMEKTDPTDPDIQFALYNVSRQKNKTSEALLYLQRSVQLDSAYVVEYLNLAAVAREKGLPDKVAEMLQLAHIAQPDNPFILMSLVRALLEAGQKEPAKALRNKLKGVAWSSIYYPQQIKERDLLLQRLEGE